MMSILQPGLKTGYEEHTLSGGLSIKGLYD